MRILISLFALSLAESFISGCGKKKVPEASFTLERYKYTTGETIKLVNTSQNAEGYIWAFPNGTSSFEKNPEYHIGPGTREWTETIQLVAHDKKNRRQNMASQTYTLNIASQPDEFFKLDSINKKPFTKFVADLANGLSSYRFLEQSENPLLQGRILLKGPLPSPGVYPVDNVSITVEATDAGYTGKMRYTSNAQWGGVIELQNDVNNRIRMIIKDLRLYEPSTQKEVLFSAQLTY
jgi:hypothetical protein